MRARTAATIVIAVSSLVALASSPSLLEGAPQNEASPPPARSALSAPAPSAPPAPSNPPARQTDPDGSGDAKQASGAQSTRRGDPYTLATCPVSGKPLGSMGAPVVQIFEGREFRFCCQGCVAPFQKDRAKYLEAIDKQLVSQQLPYYPLDTCVVMGDSLIDDGKSIAVDQIVGNRLVRYCCRQCPRKLERDPEPYLRQLDEAIVRKQSEGYPLDICVVDEVKLGSKGEPVSVVLGTRLVRLCCAACKNELERDPVKFLTRIDAAWNKHRKVAPPAE